MRLTKVEKVSGLADGLAFIFDLDGVIVDSNPVHEEAWRRYMRRFGIDLDATAIGRMFGRRNDEIVRDFFAGPPLSPERVYAHGAAKEMLYREMMRSQLDGRLVQGIREFLDRHKAAPIALATNGEPANVEFVLEEAGLRGYFRVVVDGHQVERPKPDPEIYLLAARLLDVLPENCIIFEDSEWGLEAARAAGARVVAVTTTHSSLDHASLDIDNFRSGDLEPWLNEQTPVG
jgi:beta-phosphoglucomutase family hydrolase